MEPIKLLTIGLPKLLKGIVLNAFRKYGSFEVIGHYKNPRQFLKDSADSNPNVIFVESTDTKECLEMLSSYQTVHLVSVENLGKKFYLWKLIPQKQILDALSADELVDEIMADEQFVIYEVINKRKAQASSRKRNG